MTLLPESAKLVLLRHGESEGNASKIIQGSGEYPLSEAGRRQALQARETVSLWKPTAWISSDLSRAFDTALILSDYATVIKDGRYRERGAGKWEGVAREELERAYPGAIENDDLRPDDYEAEDDVYARVIPAMMDSIAYEGLVIVVGHGAVLRLIDKEFSGTGRRFKHLEGLLFNKDLELLGRINTIGEGIENA